MTTIPLRIAFHGTEPSPAIEERVRAELDELAEIHRITSAQVTMQAPGKHHHKGGTWSVRIVLHVPGSDIAASRDHGHDHSHEDPYVALRDAFAAVARMLDDHARRVRGEVKAHELTARERAALSGGES